jgi:hypothetical protein
LKEPTTVSSVPPCGGPALGTTSVTSGVATYKNLESRSSFAAPSLSTFNLTIDADSTLTVRHKMSFGLTNFPYAGLSPKRHTYCPPRKLFPCILTTVLPYNGPTEGETPVILVAGYTEKTSPKEKSTAFKLRKKETFPALRVDVLHTADEVDKYIAVETLKSPNLQNSVWLNPNSVPNTVICNPSVS